MEVVLTKVEVRLQVAPHKCFADVCVVKESSLSGGCLARVNVVSHVDSNRILTSGSVFGGPHEHLRVGDDIKQNGVTKKPLSLKIDRGGLLIKIFCVKKDFHNMHIFIKLLEPLFDGPSKQSNYGDFQRRSLNIASSSHSSESSSTTPNSSTKTNADSKPSSSLSSEISDVKSSSNISSGMTPPESPNSRKRRTPDDDASLDDEASSLDQTSPFSPGKQQSHPISPKAPTPNINFYKKEESKDYGSFGIRPRTKSAVTSSSSSWTPLLTDGSSSDSTWPPLAASSKRGVDDGVTPPKRSKMAASTNDFSPSSSSTPAKPARKIATVLFAADTRITTPPSLNKNSKGLLNLGNSCYMNAVMQLLFSLKCFLMEMVEVGKLDVVKRPPAEPKPPRTPLGSITRFMNPLSSSLPPVTVFQGFRQLVSLWNSPNVSPIGGGQSIKTQAQSAFKKAIAAKAKQFMGRNQEDAHEFLVALLDILREEIEETKQKRTDENENIPFLPSTPSLPKTLSDVVNGPTTTTKPSIPNPVEDNFELIINNSFKCNECRRVTQNEEKLLCLETSISVGQDEANQEPSLTLQRVLDDYFGQEEVEMRCENCGGNQAVKTVSVKKSPRILLIALVRYTCDVFTTKISKNFRPVGISPFVTLHHLCEADSESPAPFSIPNAAIPNAATPSGQVKGSPIRASAALPFAKRDLDVMNKSDSKSSPGRNKGSGWLSTRKSLDFSSTAAPSSSSSSSAVKSSASDSRLVSSLATSNRKRTSFSFSDDDDNSGGYFAKSDVVVIDDPDEEMDEELRQVMQMSLLEAVGKSSEAELLRQSFQKNRENSNNNRSSVANNNENDDTLTNNVFDDKFDNNLLDFNPATTTTNKTSHGKELVVSGSATLTPKPPKPRKFPHPFKKANGQDKVKQLKHGEKAPRDEQYPSLEGFKQMAPSDNSFHSKKKVEEMTEDEQFQMALELSRLDQSGSIHISHGEWPSVPNDAPAPRFMDKSVDSTEDRDFLDEIDGVVDRDGVDHLDGVEDSGGVGDRNGIDSRDGMDDILIHPIQNDASSSNPAVPNSRDDLPPNPEFWRRNEGVSSQHEAGDRSPEIGVPRTFGNAPTTPQRRNFDETTGQFIDDIQNSASCPNSISGPDFSSNCNQNSNSGYDPSSHSIQNTTNSPNSTSKTTNAFNSTSNSTSNSAQPPSPSTDHFPASAVDPTLLRQNEERGFLSSSLRLVSVISHLGSEAGSGHYVTDAFDFRSDVWQRINDDQVTHTDIHTIRKNQAKRAYLFAYMDKGVFKKLRLNATKL